MVMISRFYFRRKMKKIVSLLAIILLFALILPGCTRVGSSMNGTGKIKDTALKLKGFTGLHIEGPFIIEVNKAEDYKVILSVDDNLVNRVRVSMERKTLNFNIEAPATFFPTSLKLKVEMPDLVSLNLSDTAVATVNGFIGEDLFTVFLSGKSTLNCATEVDTLELNVFGASETVFKGKARNTSINARGLSKLNLMEFESTAAQIKMTEASEATMNVTGWVDITLEKYSKFFYTGTPIFGDTAISGGSRMSPK
jgi:hypothetical protein